MQSFPKVLLVLTVFAFCAAFTILRQGELLLTSSYPEILDKSDIIGCAPEAATLPAIIFEDGRNIVPLPGWGSHSWKVDTKSDSALFYFNQGLNLYYSFHIQESQLSFLESLRHDSSCIMAYWGWAMTLGPTINSGGYNYIPPSLVAALRKAEKTSDNKLEQALLRSQLIRHVEGRDLERDARNRLYRDTLASLYEQYPNHQELPVLYADALMQINSRNWYEIDGTPRSGTEEIVTLLEKIIQIWPNHPAALHYYIHMVEGSLDPAKAIDEADRLIELLPSVAHMVHMPSHIYIRTGNYQKGINSNTKAISGYKDFQAVLGNWRGNKGLYFTHNADMQGANATLMGNYQEARKAYLQNMSLPDENKSDIQPRAGYQPYHGAQLYLLDIRFGKWKRILKVQEPKSRNVYQNILWLFGQGMAKAKNGDIAGAKNALDLLNDQLSDPSLLQRYGNGNRNRSLDGAAISAKLMAGTIEQVQKNWPEAIAIFKEAIVLEDQLFYSEPEDWRIPSRHLLAQAYLDKGDVKLAGITLREDLVDHPLNFWALNGLLQALILQDKKAEAAKFKKQFEEVINLADVKLTGAAF